MHGYKYFLKGTERALILLCKYVSDIYKKQKIIGLYASKSQALVPIHVAKLLLLSTIDYLTLIDISSHQPKGRAAIASLESCNMASEYTSDSDLTLNCSERVPFKHYKIPGAINCLSVQLQRIVENINF